MGFGPISAIWRGPRLRVSTVTPRAEAHRRAAAALRCPRTKHTTTVFPTEDQPRSRGAAMPSQHLAQLRHTIVAAAINWSPGRMREEEVRTSLQCSFRFGDGEVVGFFSRLSRIRRMLIRKETRNLHGITFWRY